MTLSGSVRLDGTPWVTAAWVALTGVAPDGSRHLIAEPDYVVATFNGTVLGWIQAGVGSALTAYGMPIEGRDEWLAAVARLLA